MTKEHKNKITNIQQSSLVTASQLSVILFGISYKKYWKALLVERKKFSYYECELSISHTHTIWFIVELDIKL